VLQTSHYGSKERLKHVARGENPGRTIPIGVVTRLRKSHSFRKEHLKTFWRNKGKVSSIGRQGGGPVTSQGWAPNAGKKEDGKKKGLGGKRGKRTRVNPCKPSGEGGKKKQSPMQSGKTNTGPTQQLSEGEGGKPLKEGCNQLKRVAGQSTLWCITKGEMGGLPMARVSHDRTQWENLMCRFTNWTWDFQLKYQIA